MPIACYNATVEKLLADFPNENDVADADDYDDEGPNLEEAAREMDYEIFDRLKEAGVELRTHPPFFRLGGSWALRRRALVIVFCAQMLLCSGAQLFTWLSV